MSLTINFVIRHRPTLVEIVTKTLPLISRDDTVLMISADEDDDAVLSQIKQLPKDKRIRPIVLPREDGIGEKHNRALLYAPADVYVAQTDNWVNLTPGFDQKILDAAELFPDGIGVVQSRLACLCFPWIQAITAPLAKIIGYIYPPHFPYWFIDHWMDDMARYIDRVAYVDLEMVHVGEESVHATLGKRDLKFWSVLYDALYLHRWRDALAVIYSADFEEPKWRRKLLRQSLKRIDDYSRLASISTRRESAMADVGQAPWPKEEEERYQRIKTRGAKLLREAMAEIEALRA